MAITGHISIILNLTVIIDRSEITSYNNSLLPLRWSAVVPSVKK